MLRPPARSLLICSASSGRAEFFFRRKLTIGLRSYVSDASGEFYTFPLSPRRRRHRRRVCSSVSAFNVSQRTQAICIEIRETSRDYIERNEGRIADITTVMKLSYTRGREKKRRGGGRKREKHAINFRAFSLLSM